MKAADYFLEYYRKIRFISLFFFLLLSVGLIPLLSEWGFGYAADILQVFLVLAITASLITIVNQRLLFVLLVILFLRAVLRLLYLLFHFNVMLPPGEWLQVVFCSMVVVVILRYVMQAKEVNNDVVFAALCVYLLFGLLFGFIYFIVEGMWPGSLVHTRAGLPFTGGIQLSQTIYFSFVTLATLGYGDIIPASEVIRSLAIIQTICGQVYLVVLFARLVTLYGGTSKS
jgi:voltage-gated potassium channel